MLRSYHFNKSPYKQKKYCPFRQCISNVATGCHFTGPIALRLKLSADLLITIFSFIIHFIPQNVHKSPIIFAEIWSNIYRIVSVSISSEIYTFMPHSNIFCILSPVPSGASFQKTVQIFHRLPLFVSSDPWYDSYGNFFWLFYSDDVPWASDQYYHSCTISPIDEWHKHLSPMPLQQHHSLVIRQYLLYDRYWSVYNLLHLPLHRQQ